MEKVLSVAAHKLLLLGGSAGSLDILLFILQAIRTPVHLAIVVILHRRPDDEGNLLVNLLNTKTSLLVKEAEEKEVIAGGCVYVAPGDYHLLIENDKTLSLDHSEKIQYSRPSIDVSFETAAEAYGKNAFAILLSGANQDGANGLIAIKKAGGTTIVQQPSTAAVPFMPAYAARYASPDKILSPETMVDFINLL